jgi:diguanylate cyclase (GGDEF)-like protein
MSKDRLLTQLRDAIEGGSPEQLATTLEAITEEHQKLHQRLDKISRISDGYQEQLRELNRKLQEANQNLSHALSEVKTLRGLIPICARCKRIRDDHGLWDQIETYISQHSEAVFSHGVCPECAKVLFPSAASSAQIAASSSDEGPRVAAGPAEAAIKARLAIIREDPAWKGHPLLTELDWLGVKHLRLLRRLEKISRISDGFQRDLKVMNASLQKSSRTDYLTGLANRREMMERLKAELSRTMRGRLPLSLIMADVDRFKSVNDTFGHEAGDLLLQAIAATLRAALRDYDLCSRWGGEEFLVLLPETSLEDAAVVAEKLRDRVGQVEVDNEGYRVRATISLGLSTHHRGETLTSLLQRTDEAMYSAKRLGRNRVKAAEPPEHV